jgi:hypothetical protein
MDDVSRFYQVSEIEKDLMVNSAAIKAVVHAADCPDQGVLQP